MQVSDYGGSLVNYAIVGWAVFTGLLRGGAGEAAGRISAGSFYTIMLIHSFTLTLDACQQLAQVGLPNAVHSGCSKANSCADCSALLMELTQFHRTRDLNQLGRWAVSSDRCLLSMLALASSMGMHALGPHASTLLGVYLAWSVLTLDP